MKNLLIALLAISLFSCNDDENDFNINALPCTNNLGHFELLPSSLTILPYEGKSKVIFKDSLDNRVEFIITREEHPVSSKFYVTNISGHGMPVKYCYTTHRLAYILHNDSLLLDFGVDLSANPAEIGSSPNNAKDELIISGIPEINPYELPYAVFTEYADHDNGVFIGQFNILDTSYECFGEIFQNVEHLNTASTITDPYEIHFNFNEGLVSFRDLSGHHWCFERFE